MYGQPTAEEVREYARSGMSESEICERLAKRYEFSDAIVEQLIRPVVREVLKTQA